MSDAGKWLATERGAFEIHIAARPMNAKTSPPLAATYKIVERLSDIERVLLYSFREGLPGQKES